MQFHGEEAAVARLAASLSFEEICIIVSRATLVKCSQDSFALHRRSNGSVAVGSSRVLEVSRNPHLAVSLSVLLAKAVQRSSAVLRALRLLLVCVSEGQHTSDSLSLIVDECFLLTAYILRKHRGSWISTRATCSSRKLADSIYLYINACLAVHSTADRFGLSCAAGLVLVLAGNARPGAGTLLCGRVEGSRLID